jgi:hypothetical protein
MHTSAPYHTLPYYGGVDLRCGPNREAACCAPLADQPILIVEGRTDHFILALLDTLEQAGAEMAVARDAADALELLKRYEFSACLIGCVDGPPENYRALMEELGAVPVLLYGEAQSSFTCVNQPAALVPGDVHAIVEVLTTLLR